LGNNENHNHFMAQYYFLGPRCLKQVDLFPRQICLARRSVFGDIYALGIPVLLEPAVLYAK